MRQTYGYAKAGAGRGYTGVNGLNVLLATLSVPARAAGSVPLIAAARLREGAASSTRRAWKLVADALGTARRCGAGGLVIVRADSAYYAHPVVATARRAGARFSVTVRHTAAVTRAIAAIPDAAWTPIRYRHAVWDPDEHRWVSEAEVAEIGFTAFTGRRRSEHVHARLIVRRVRRLNPDTAPAAHRAQGELFAAYRYHASFTDSPMSRWIQAHPCYAEWCGPGLWRHSWRRSLLRSRRSAVVIPRPPTRLPSTDHAKNTIQLP